MKSAESFKIGVDVGGTFTDITLVGSDGAITVHKTPSTPEAPAQPLMPNSAGIGRDAVWWFSIPSNASNRPVI